MKNRRIISLVIALAILMSMAACSAGGAKPTAEPTKAPVSEPTKAPEAPVSQESEVPQPETITITDHLGYEVTLPADIQRVAIYGIYPLASALTVFFNSAEKIVAMPKASLSAAKSGLLGQLYPEILDVHTECVSGEEINMEELMKLQPDVVFYSDTEKAAGEALKNAGFNAVAVSVTKWSFNCIETLSNWIDLLGQMFPGDDKAEIYREYSQDIYNLVQERVSGLTEEEKVSAFILFQYTEANMLTSGAKHFGQWWCDAIGAKNAAGEVEGGQIKVDMEQIYSWNPDVILVSNFTTAQPEDLYENTVGSYDWGGVNAIENQRVYKMPLGIYRSYTPSADTPVTLLWMAKTVYPQLFEDMDVTSYAKAYYKTVYGVELTEDQIESVFAPVSAAASGV